MALYSGVGLRRANAPRAHDRSGMIRSPASANGVMIVDKVKILRYFRFGGMYTLLSTNSMGIKVTTIESMAEEFMELLDELGLTVTREAAREIPQWVNELKQRKGPEDRVDTELNDET